MALALALALLLVPCASAQALSADACAASAALGPVACATCLSDASAGVNSVEQLPRLSRLGVASSNLGSYAASLFSCASNASLCSFVEPSFVAFGKGAPPPSKDSLLNYIESGPLLYAALGLLLAVLCAVGGLLFCCCRSCCCFCAGLCGKTHPTLARGRTCCFCCPVLGFTKYDAGYSHTSKVCVRAGLALNLTCIALLVLSGHVLGNVGITNAFRVLAAAPAGFAATVFAMRGPVAELVVSLSADALSPFLGFVDCKLTATDAGSFGLPAVKADVECLRGLEAVLPNTTMLVLFLESAYSFIGSLTNVSNALVSDVAVAEALLGNVSSRVVALGFDLSRLEAGVASLSANSAVTEAALTALGIDCTVAEGAGTAAQLAASSGASSLPSAAAALALAGPGAPNTLTALASLQLQGAAGSSGRAALNTSLVAFLAALSQTSSNLSVVADQLDIFIVSTQSSLSAVGAVNASLGNVATDASILPLALLQADVASLQALLAVAVAPVAVLRASLVALQQLLLPASLPPFAAAISTLNAIQGFGAILHCAEDLVAQVGLLNATIMALPPALLASLAEVSNLNASAASVVGLAAAESATLSQLSSDLTAVPSLAPSVASLDALSAAMMAPPVNLTAVGLSIQSASSELVAANITAAVSSLAALNASLTVAMMGLSSSSVSLRQLQATVLSPLAASLVGALAALETYSFGFLRCGVSSNTACAVAGSACGGAVCQGGLAQCSLDSSQQCQADSDCAAGSGVCPFHGALFTQATASLDAYASAAPAAVLASAAAALSALTAALATAPLPASLAALTATLGGLPLSTYSASVAALAASVDSSSLGLASPQALLQSALASVSSFDFDSVEAQVEGFSAQIDSVTGTILPLLSSADAALSGLLGVLKVSLPAALANMTRPELEAIYSEDGLAGLVEHVLDTAQTLLGAVANASSAAYTLPALPDLRSEAAGFLPYLRALDNEAALKAGPFAFFAGLAKIPTVSAAQAGPGGSVFASANGSAWASSELCLTSACVDATIAAYNDNALKVGSFGLPLSREQLFLALFTAPVLPALLALLAMLAVVPCSGTSKQQARGRCRSGGCQRGLFGCASCLSCIQLPFIFTFAGALSFTLVLVLADACRGAPNVGAFYLAHSQAALCSSFGGGVLASGSCSITLPTAALGVAATINLDLVGIYSAVVGRQCDVSGSELSSVYSELGAVASILPAAAANASLTSLSQPGGLVQLRPALVNATDAMLAAVGDSASAFVLGLGSVLNCAVLASDIGAVVDGLCCSLVGALWWWATAWYLLGFALLALFALSILALKRLPSRLFGPEAADAGLLVDEAIELRGASKKQDGGDTSSVSVLSPSAAGAGLHRVAPAAISPTKPRLGGVAAPMRPLPPLPPPVPPRLPSPRSPGTGELRSRPSRV